MNEPYTLFDRGWLVRIQRPEVVDGPPRVLLLLHGWTGDETVMWIFARNVPKNTWIFAPRGPVTAPDGGYGWLPHASTLPALNDFQLPAQALREAVHHWLADAHLPDQPVDVMGFSQGAAMAYALATYFPSAVNRLMALAGFLPTAPADRYQSLAEKQIYIAHGSHDETVPVAMAQSAVKTLQAVGAQVTYCESEVGHKLSAGCLKGLETFLK